MDVKEHGVWLESKRIQCNYCGKEIQSWFRLKRHLGCVGTLVTHCDKVTSTLRQSFRSLVMKKDSVALTSAKRLKVNPQKPGRREASASASASASPTKSVSPRGLESIKQGPLYESHKRIARFFYENYFDVSSVDSQGFREMMSVGCGCNKTEITLPSSHDLNGWMLQELLKEVEDHVNKVKDSWVVTGCSILLDAWVDQEGHDLVTFIADSPAGPVYLKSFDVSDIKGDINALLSLVDEVIDEVGMHNVVQIIACSTSGWVGELGESFASNNTNVFWSVSVSHCFELMLEKIAKMDSLEDILNISELFNNKSHGVDVSPSSEFEFVMPYLTLESIFKAKNEVLAMLDSSDWNKEGDFEISKLVKGSSFWETVERAVKSTSPLVRGLLLFSSANNNQLVGYIYDTMDSIKESIAKEFDNEEPSYKPLWDVVDDVWNNHLYSPLHAAGYFLNPSAFYSTDFHLDPEVATGLASTLVRLVKESDTQVKVSAQLDMYRLGKHCFDEASQADQISEIPPAEWWARKASQRPELQNFAIRVLSQTCEGASRYKLKRSLAEKLFVTGGMRRQHLEEMAFVHYNLHLQRCNISKN